MFTPSIRRREAVRGFIPSGTGPRVLIRARHHYQSDTTAAVTQAKALMTAASYKDGLKT